MFIFYNTQILPKGFRQSPMFLWMLLSVCLRMAVKVKMLMPARLGSPPDPRRLARLRAGSKLEASSARGVRVRAPFEGRTGSLVGPTLGPPRWAGLPGAYPPPGPLKEDYC